MTNDLIFDESCNLRLLSLHDHEHSTNLTTTCTRFIHKVQELNSLFKPINASLITTTNEIEVYKKYAIGSRIRLNIKRRGLQDKVLQKQMELDRILQEVEALEKVRDYQRVVISSLHQ
jgi:Intraflagellar transport complex B, subunit 20